MSRCLGLDACRYNGQSVRSDIVRQLTEHVDVISVCPEVEIGLGVPREPVRLVASKEREGLPRLIQPATGRDLTGAMKSFGEALLGALPPVDGFVLKNRSPSCGIGDVRVYLAVEKSPPVAKDAGAFGRLVLERFPGAAIEDEGRLRNARLRDRFLTSLWTLARFRFVEESGRAADLVGFHTSHKYILMAFHRAHQRRMGHVVANHERLPIPTVIRQYRDLLGAAMQGKDRRERHIDVLLHGFGYVNDQLDSREKAFFLDAVREYHGGRVPLGTVRAILHTWILRFDVAYLIGQHYFDPYPSELAVTA